MTIVARDPADPENGKRVAEAREIIDSLDVDALSDWESTFIDNLENEWLPNDRITENQLHKLRSIADRDGEYGMGSLDLHRDYD